MSNDSIIRAWKDENYRLNLSEEEQERLPDSPVGSPDASDDDLESVSGGHDSAVIIDDGGGCTCTCCTCCGC